MSGIAFLLIAPFCIAIVLAVTGHHPLRRVIVWAGALTIMAASIRVALTAFSQGPVYYPVEFPSAEKLFFAGDILLTLYLLYRCKDIRRSEWWIPAVIVLQGILLAVPELSHSAPPVFRPFYIDNLSAIMVLIIGIIGSLICIYALSYMKDHHAHASPDRRKSFFFLLFLFLSAMFGVVLSNHLSWMYFFWEVTTLCSFLLIGYSRTDEAVRNAFRALGLNALGGLGFVLAIVYQVRWSSAPTLELDRMIANGSLVLIPAVLIAFAGMAKSAQFPFSSWLLGAMVAPTPVSALLHSSTMVKAGVFGVIKFAPVFQGTWAGTFVALVGGVTFLFASLAAVTQSNAKRVLAYSTVANLGLIVACAGVGTAQAVWAGILLIIFHAVSKGLLFLGTGTLEHRIGSRDIEDMGGLIVTRPSLALIMVTGIMGMFLAPFGMLISKWACLQAFVDANLLLAVLLAFGSAPTLFFWSKWMGKLISAPRWLKPSGDRIPVDEWTALGILAGLTLLACLLFPLASSAVIDPYLAGIYHESVDLNWENIIIMGVMLAGVLILPLAFLLFPRRAMQTDIYLAGANVSEAGSFTDSLGNHRAMHLRNYYLTGLLDEKTLMLWGGWLAGLVTAAAVLLGGLR